MHLHCICICSLLNGTTPQARCCFRLPMQNGGIGSFLWYSGGIRIGLWWHIQYTVRGIVLKMKKKFPLLRIRISSKYQIWGLPKVFSGMLWCISFMLLQCSLSHLVFCFGNITHIVRLEDNKSSRSICVCVGTNKHHRCINMTTSPLNFGVLKALQSVGTSSVFVLVYY